MNKNNDYSKKLSIFNKLKKMMNNHLVNLSWNDKSLLFTFKNNYKVLVLSIDKDNLGERKFLIYPSIQIFYDKDFKNIEKMVNGVFNDKNDYLFNIIESFSNKKFSKKERNYQYQKIVSYQLKKIFYKNFRNETNPDKEFFLFGNDELKKRYSYKKAKLDNSLVKIIDSSALLIKTDNNGYILDIDTGLHYKDNNFIYLDNVFSYKRCKRSDKEMTIFSSKNGKERYFKKVLKNGVDLKKSKKNKYLKADGLVMKLKRVNGIYFLFHKGKKINICHPDLLIYKL